MNERIENSIEHYLLNYVNTSDSEEFNINTIDLIIYWLYIYFKSGNTIFSSKIVGKPTDTIKKVI